jgi:ferredoxin
LAAIAAHLGCQSCIPACPRAALRLDPDGVRLDGACIGCGRCAAACRTGAIRVAGIPVRPDLTSPASPVIVECARVPASALAPGARRVPCLGALSTADLLSLRADAGDRPILLIDHGWCEGCSAGGTADHPAKPALLRTETILQAMGLAHLAPILASRPLSRRRHLRPLPFDSVAAPARRRLMQRLSLGLPATPAPPAGPPAAAPNPNATERLIVALTRLAQQHATAIPRLAVPNVSVSAACENHQVCVRVCPTGALSVADAGDHDALRFDPSRCIACGGCRRLCPEGAIHVTPAGPAGSALDPDPLVVARHARRACMRCGQSFAGPGTASECPSCRKTLRLAAAVAALRAGGPFPQQPLSERSCAATSSRTLPPTASQTQERSTPCLP